MTLKRSKLVTLLCVAILGVVVALSVTLISVLPQISGSSGRKLVFTSGDMAANYSGNSVTSDDWELTSGTLKPGHKAEVTVKGSQKNVGKSENYFTVKIRDENGLDVTDEYDIELRPGTITILPSTITIISGSGAKVYDGTPLTNSNFTVTPANAIPANHTVEVDITGSVVEIGEAANTIEGVHIKNPSGKDISYNFNIITIDGILKVVEDEASLPDLPEFDVSTDDLLSGLEGMIGQSPTLDLTGNIGLPPGMSSIAGLSDQACYIINTNRPGKVYLKILSFGDYTDNSWGTATPYGMLIDQKYAAYYLTSIAMENAGATPYSISVKPINKQLAMPYFALPTEIIEISDTYVAGEYDTVANYLYYDHTQYSMAVLPEAYTAYESEYRSFVYQNYLNIDEETLAYMNLIIAEKGFSRNSETIIKDVENYISNAAKYSLDYDRQLDEEENVAIAFLRDYQRGICQHYSTAATLLYRALGIPARYTVGFVGNAVAGTDSKVSGNNAHAWVEVYIDGTGWVISEVTGGYYNNNMGGSDVGEDTPSDGLIKITVKPGNIDKRYDGTPLSAAASDTNPGAKVYIVDDLQYSSISSDEFMKKYTYEAVVEGERTDVGKSNSRIVSFIIKDKDNNDVTELFDITYGEGEIHVYARVLVFTSRGHSVVYNGQPLVGNISDVFIDEILSEELLEGHEYSKEMVKEATITDVGDVANDFIVTIYDEMSGENVTDCYKIKLYPSMLTVTPREITVRAGSDEKAYDGTPLTCDIVEMDPGQLIDGHYIYCEINDSQTYPGSCDNLIKSIIIEDSNGNDVTSNYSVEFIPGKLTVTISK